MGMLLRSRNDKKGRVEKKGSGGAAVSSHKEEGKKI